MKEFEWNRIHKWEDNIEHTVTEWVTEYIIDYYEIDGIEDLTAEQIESIEAYRDELNEFSVMQIGFSNVINWWENAMYELKTELRKRMMSNNTYRPDKWLLIKINGTDPHYRVFGSWSGGYLDGDSWRMNSGITRVEEDDEYFYFHGYSGSVYECHKKMYGATAYCWTVAKSYEEKTNNTLIVLDEMPEEIVV
jgi:hypothetical protein